MPDHPGERFLVAAPAGVADKHHEKFADLWACAVALHGQSGWLDLPTRRLMYQIIAEARRAMATPSTGHPFDESNLVRG